MNRPSTKSMFSTGHSMSQCFNKIWCTRIAIREKLLKIVHFKRFELN